MTAASLFLLLFTSARAQSQTPVGFLPGLAEGPDVWQNSGASLAAAFNIAPFYPFLPSTDPMATQAFALGSVATNAFLVGHSAGGVVARLKAQPLGGQQNFAGIITLGTPNYGAPILTTYPVFCSFLGGTVFDAALLALSLNRPADDWIIDNLEPDYGWGLGLLGVGCDYLVAQISGIGTPAAFDLSASSTFMNSLNAAGNVAVEQANVPIEASVVITTANFYDSGWLKAAFPDGPAEAWGHVLQGLAGLMVGEAVYIELNSDPEDQHAIDVANHLFDFADDILFMDEAWCESVSGTLFLCSNNDETVPVWSQALGRGTTFAIDGGPVHTREAQAAGALLPGVLSALGFSPR